MVIIQTETEEVEDQVGRQSSVRREQEVGPNEEYGNTSTDEGDELLAINSKVLRIQPLITAFCVQLVPHCKSTKSSLKSGVFPLDNRSTNAMTTEIFYPIPQIKTHFFSHGAIPLNRDLWTDGYFSDVAKLVGGVWLRVWIQVAAAMSTIGMFEAEMSGDSFQLLGMAERGMLPTFFAKRSRYGTPLVGILFSASGIILLSWLSFEEIVAAENFLYCFGMVLEFISFIRLRIKYPATSRPFKIPLGTVGSILLCIPPTISVGVVLAVSSLKVAVISLVAVVIGLVMQPCLKHVEKKKWLKFSENSDLPDPLRDAAHEDTETLIH
ncbi:hypothetical protein RHSIM_Rhsim07G0139500 [Rhododendron simsii]|uniref:Uncharacterized protein n=1 Tax=Rhododendron simsii TaxID=118357 RepID=A0A834GTR6_RHOSS|nr:hypothetical protein RHSIM_Rhsim07G0139500 [Rhododendron simsii]